jgi:hypothetical protein
VRHAYHHLTGLLGQRMNVGNGGVSLFLRQMLEYFETENHIEAPSLQLAQVARDLHPRETTQLRFCLSAHPQRWLVQTNAKPRKLLQALVQQLPIAAAEIEDFDRPRCIFFAQNLQRIAKPLVLKPAFEPIRIVDRLVRVRHSYP